MSYFQTTLSGPGYRYVYNNYSGRHLTKVQRGERRERTKDEMEKQNARNRAIHTQLLILGNFKNGWHMTLTYKKEDRPPDIESAKKILKNFLARVGRRYKKAGFEFKWLYVTEIGSHGAIHHHLIIEDIQEGSFSSQRAVRDCWEGGLYFTPMYEDGEYQALSEYLVKKESKEKITGCKVTHSRNLIMPKVTRKKKKGFTWLPEPRVPTGWELIKDSLHNGINAFTGLPCQQYLLIESRKGGRDAGKDLCIHHNKEHPPGGRDGEVRDDDRSKREGSHTNWRDKF